MYFYCKKFRDTKFFTKFFFFTSVDLNLIWLVNNKSDVSGKSIQKVILLQLQLISLVYMFLCKTILFQSQLVILANCQWGSIKICLWQ